MENREQRNVMIKFKDLTITLIAYWKHYKKRLLVTENWSLENIQAESWGRKRMETADDKRHMRHDRNI